MDNLRFEAATIADLDALLALARAFHAEDGHALSQAGAGALATVAGGEPLARCWPSPSARRRSSASACCISRSSRAMTARITSIGATALPRAGGG